MPATPDGQIAANLLDELQELVDARDRAGAVALVLDAIATRQLTIPNLYVRVLGPYLAQIGAQWSHGTESVWEEHLASHVVLTIVEALYPAVLREAAIGAIIGDTATGAKTQG